MLVYSLSQFGLALTPSLDLCENYEICVNILSMPYQYLRPHMRGAIIRARTLIASNERSMLTACGELDWDLMRRALSELPSDLRPSMRWLLSLSHWDNTFLATIDQADSCVCRCGAPHTMMHWCWECPFTKHLRDDFSFAICFTITSVFHVAVSMTSI